MQLERLPLEEGWDEKGREEGRGRWAREGKGSGDDPDWGGGGHPHTRGEERRGGYVLDWIGLVARKVHTSAGSSVDDRRFFRFSCLPFPPCPSSLGTSTVGAFKACRGQGEVTLARSTAAHQAGMELPTRPGMRPSGRMRQ